MRKVSHDGGDSTSITSGVENEVKKSAMKSKKTSLKRKVPSFKQDSDDTVIEPLLQKEKQKTETTQSAKYLTKEQTDSLQNKEIDNTTKTTSSTGFCGTTESLLSFKDSEVTKTTSGVVAPLHNYMNTNVFNTHDNSKVNVTAKSQILVEIDGSKQSGYNPSPLIFTTAKIHTDSKSKNMEPVQVTPVPILSTIEVCMSKEGSFTTNEKKISNGSSVINPVYSTVPFNKGKEEERVTADNSRGIVSPTNKDAFGKNITTSTNKLSNDTLGQSSSMDNSLPLAMPKSVISNNKDKQVMTKDIQAEQEKNIQSQLKPLNLVDLSSKPTKINQSSNQTDKTQINKLDESSENKTAINVSSNGSLHFATSAKTQNSIESSSFVKHIGSSVGNKQLQRQKTITDETCNVDSKTKTNMKSPESSSAKTEFSLHAKVLDSNFIKDSNDKLSKTSANIDTQRLNRKSVNATANVIGNVTSISTSKPNTTNKALINTVTTPSDISSKPSITSLPYFGISPTTTSINTLSNMSKTGIASLVTDDSTAITKSSVSTLDKISDSPTSNTIVKCPEITFMRPVTTVGKSVPAKISSVTASTAIKTTSVSSDNSRASNVSIIKSSPTVTSSVTTAKNQPHAKPTAITKSPFTTSIKSSPINSINTIKTSSASTSHQTSKTANTKPPSTSVDLIVSTKVTTSAPVTTQSIIAHITRTPQNSTSSQVSADKKSETAISIDALSKTPSISTSGKPITVKTSATTTATVKSPNNNSSQIPATSKPSTTSTTKISPSITTLTKTSAASPSTSVSLNTTLTSPQGTSSITTPKTSSVTSKKPAITKTQAVATKSPQVGSVNNSIVGSTMKLPSAVTAVPTTISKQHDSKSGLVKPTVSSTTTSTTAIKPTAANTVKVSTNKPVGIAGSSVPSSTPVLRSSESIKKSGSKSSEKTKEGKVSKG